MKFLTLIILLATATLQAQVTGADLVKGVNSPTGNSFLAVMKTHGATALIPTGDIKYYYAEKGSDKCTKNTITYSNKDGDVSVVFTTSSLERYKTLAQSFVAAGFEVPAKNADAPVDTSDVSSTNPGIILKVTVAEKADACDKTQTFYTVKLAR